MSGAIATRLGRDRGAASLWLLALGLLLVGAGLVGAATGSVRVARHEARVAADLGALAGAARVIEGGEAACQRAGLLVVANGARMVDCRVDGLDLIVHAEVAVTPLPGLRRVTHAQARAGPFHSPKPAGGPSGE